MTSPLDASSLVQRPHKILERKQSPNTVNTSTNLLRIVPFTLLIFLWCGGGNSAVYAQDSSDVKKVKGLEKDAKKVEGFFKKLFHHDDSAKMARQYIREQQRQVKGNPKNRYNVDHKSLGIPVKTYMPEVEFDLDYEVLGWYPYWEKEYYKHINYSLLSTIAYFSYELNPRTGEAKTTHEWESTKMIDSAKAHGTRVLLTVTNFGDANNREFLKNTRAQNKLITNLIDLLKKRGGHGVCIDFEGVPKGQMNNLTRFMMLLDQQLKDANDDYLIYMAVPAVNWQKSINASALTQAVDKFAIMGYNYYGKLSKVAGPVGPLLSGDQWEPFNLNTSVDYYLSEGVPASKLLLALPYYGSIWETRNSDMGAKTVSYVGPRTYDYIRTKIKAPVRYDTISYSAWYSYVVQEGNKTKFRQCWFDNDSTFAVKLNFIKTKNLAGMGIWALGYDKGYDDLWKVIGDNMTTTKTYPIEGIGHGPGDITSGETVDDGNDGKGATNPKGDQTLDPSDKNPPDPGDGEEESFWSKLTDIEGLLSKVVNHKSVLLLILALVVFFGGVGLVIAMFQPNTRMYFFSSTSYVVYYSGFVLLFLVVALRWKNILNNTSVAVILGFTLGGFTVWGVNKLVQKIHRDMP